MTKLTDYHNSVSSTDFSLLSIRTRPGRGRTLLPIQWPLQAICLAINWQEHRA